MTESRIVSLIGQKGGCGKTTLATTIAYEHHQRGIRTLLVDTDEQESSLKWAAAFAEASPPTVGMRKNLIDQVDQLADAYQLTVIDTPARKSYSMGDALMTSDVCLMPVIPSDLDLDSLGSTLEAVARAQRTNRRLIARVVVNHLNPRTILGSGFESRVQELLDTINDEVGGEFGICERTIGHREDFRKAVSSGIGVTYYPKTKAAQEATALCAEVDALLGKGEAW